ncbi:MAG: PEP-CTERM sorting domain-containing protein [Akkermansiaceae bacterium]|jgi:hypothetical protein|nr:PEP-CTERM sorting domain-containing protein [Akkermansiaceae bacterium]MDP4899186.1 PEP-CTERM sorting domain-containing protein [Akkermansiaceae bacterium]MDP4995735.1 PEP-CTERM sorting domain-containing protein [Akkermansiaceae bacterium]
MKSTLAIPLLLAALASSAPGAITVGTWINIDYGTRGGTPGAGVSYAGAVNTGQWNSHNGGHSGPTTRVDSTGGAVTFGIFAGQNSSGGVGNFNLAGGSPADLVGQDYLFLNNNVAGDVTLNGRSVGSLYRFTIYNATTETNGIALGQTWNITFSGGGDTVGQGLNLDVNNGGTIVTATLPGPTTTSPWSGYADGVTYTTLNGIKPTENGAFTEIEFWMWTPAGSATDATSAISGIQMQLVPEPSSAALLGLAGIALLARRRR